MAFEYPSSPHVRRHGPQGYTDYSSYREWLRDEFSFRCVFCLQREQWVQMHAAYHIDHLVPQALAPDLTCDYDNLLYVCSGCNALKTDLSVPDPCRIAYGCSVRVRGDGTIEAFNRDGRRLIKVLRLDNADRTRYRRRMVQIIKAAKAKNTKLLKELMAYPDDLPDLSTLRPPLNTRPTGVAMSCFAKRSRGELPEMY